MTSVAQLNALIDRAVEGLTQPAYASAAVRITTDREAAKQELLLKLPQKFTGEDAAHWHETLAVAVRTNPEAEKMSDGWEVRHRPFSPHEVDRNRIVWIPFNHGGPWLQAAYYFNWDGEE